MLLTGGLGALGVLVACWVAAADGAGGGMGGAFPGAQPSSCAGCCGAAIRLLGRSGRASAAALASPPLRALLTGGGISGGVATLVTLERCDAATAEEAADAVRGRAAPLGAILHAAGVLEVRRPEARS